MDPLPLSMQLLAQGGDMTPAVTGIGFLLCFGVFGLFGIAVTVFWVWMLVDCIQNEPNHPDNQLVIWLLVILLASWVGALIYYFVRKKGRR